MKEARKEVVKRILYERKRAAIFNSKSSMRQLIAGKNREALGAASEEGDLSVVFQNESMQYMQFSSQRELIIKIDSALKRIEDGAYGICEECNQEISEDRLRIIPFALYCRDCQETMELEKNRKKTGIHPHL